MFQKIRMTKYNKDKKICLSRFSKIKIALEVATYNVIYYVINITITLRNSYEWN